MQRVIFNVDNAANAKLLVHLTESLGFIKSVKIEKGSDEDSALTEDDWVRPGRPATDAEVEQMLAEAEVEYKAGKGMSLEEAKAITKKKIEAWKKANHL